MKATALTRITGIVLIIMGLLGMFGWYAHIIPFISIYSGTNGILNEGLGFFLFGTAFLFLEFQYSLQKKISTGIGVLVALLAVGTLSQNIFNYSLGINQTNNSALIFLFSGVAFAAFPYLAKKNIAVFTQICIFNTLILGLSTLVGYLFGLKVLYSWKSAIQMPLLSAIGNAFLGFGLWSLWQQKAKHNYIEVLPGNEGKQIMSLSLTIFFCIFLLSGFDMFNMLFLMPNGNNHFLEMQSTILLTFLIGTGTLCWQLVPLIWQSISAEKNLLQANLLLRESENKFRSAFDNAAIGMALILPDGTFSKVNKSLCKLLGYAEEELLGVNIQRIMHLEDLQENKAYINEMLKIRNKVCQQVQRYLHKNGEVVWAAVSMSLVCDGNDIPSYFIAQLQNITAEKRAEERLLHLAYHDALTGLFNRNCLEQKIQGILSSARRSGRGFALVFLDLDRFKNINDTIGHDAGDMLLKVVGQRLKNNVRNTDILARIGGDEFVLVLNELNQVDQVSNVVRKILAHLLQPITIKSHEVYVTTSMGISVFPYDGNDVQTLMKNADLALYRAKELGRNNYQFCTLEMTTKAQQKMSRQNAIIQAMAKNEFVLYFQPKLNLEEQTISGVEALLRWHNAMYSNINAIEIIHLAEETGLIITLNEWVFKTACMQVKAWHEAGFLPLNLSVNLSGKQFKQINFVENLLHMLDQTGFPPEYLELEITESLIMQDPEYIFHILHSLKEKKISIAIDDFGTGYSSLDYLRRFSIDKIKIDKKFIQTLTIDAVSTSVVSAIIAMSNKLGIQTVAEGVETRAQYEFLLHEKCTEIQGFYLSPPVDVNAISRFLKNPMMQSYLMRTSDDDYSGE